MTKYIISLVMVIATVFGARADKYTIDRDALPATAQEFLTKHFPKAKVGMIKVDRHLLKKTDYDVRLVNGTKIEFNSKGEWTDVDCKTREVPEAIIPRAVRRYVTKNYPDNKIVEIEKRPTKIEVKLNDGVELTFDRLGNLKKVDLDD